MTRTTHTAHRAALAALAALAAVAAIIAADLTVPVSAQSEDERTGQIVARRLDDGRVEFGWQPTIEGEKAGARVLPRQRYFPADATADRWLRSSPVEVGGVAIGRINARLLSDGRIEFAFTPTGRKRIAPPARYFPTDATPKRWLHSTQITIRPPVQLPTIRVFAGEAGVTEAQLAEVRQRMTSVVREFAARWGAVAVPPAQVQVHITEAAQRAASGYGRLHSCAQPYTDEQGNKTIAYRFGCSGPSHFVLAHEYAHVAQTYSGGFLAYFPNTPLWMLEGVAEWVESIYESQNGGRSYQALQSGNWWTARQARNRYALDDPGLCGCPPHYAAYTMGFVAAERLAQLAGEQAIFDFWPNLRRAEQNRQGSTGPYSKTIAEAFEATFGITLADFYATFDDYLNGDRPSIRIAPTS